jgi:hypothetical protein
METSLIYKGSDGLANIDQSAAVQIAEKVLAENGNLIKLTAVERKIYYLAMCDRYQLDPWSSPFDYLEQKKSGVVDRVSLYPNIRAANFKAEQRGLSVEIVSRKTDITGKEKGKYGDYEAGWAEVEVKVSDGKRSLNEIGCVEITATLKRGDAMKKAMTQARRRAILAFCGLSDGGEQTISAESYDPPVDVLPLRVVPVQATEMRSAAIAPSEDFQYKPTYISRDQTKQFWATAKKNDWTEAMVSLFLSDLECTDDSGEVSSKFIQLGDYEGICDRLADPNERDEYQAETDPEEPLSESEEIQNYLRSVEASLSLGLGHTPADRIY